MDAWMQALEDCDGKDASHMEGDMEMDEEELELDRERVQTTEDRIQVYLPAQRYKLLSQQKGICRQCT